MKSPACGRTTRYRPSRSVRVVTSVELWALQNASGRSWAGSPLSVTRPLSSTPGCAESCAENRSARATNNPDFPIGPELNIVVYIPYVVGHLLWRTPADPARVDPVIALRRVACRDLL